MWRIRIDTANNQLALEVRDPDLLMAYFYTLDAADLKLSSLNLNPSKAWWQGLEDALYGLVYLHGYGDRKTGQHKGITAVAPETGQVQWELQKEAFYGFSENGLLVYKADAPEDALTVVDARTGSILGTGISQQEAAKNVTLFSRSRYAGCVYPVQYKEGEPYFEDVCNFLKAQSGAAPVKAVEYTETSSCIVISYYEYTNTGELDNFAVVYDLDGGLSLKVKLGSGLSGIGSDTFFIFNLNLYLLLDKQILQVYRI
ncbi:DUF4905 domain-containing protein [Pontibacter sp. H249]|uniref:DUF4905 domain-containing protein n=1 Tax=Pontibacter sp. H249 TaxID=3133420 RepID=UPI0030C3D306